MTKNDCLVEQLNAELATHIDQVTIAHGEVTLECKVQNIKAIMLELRDNPLFAFDQLIRLMWCGLFTLRYLRLGNRFRY